MQKKRARERIIMFLCIISLLFTPVLAASQSNAMRVSLDLKSATVKEFFVRGEKRCVSKFGRSENI